jgi:hypothetical protein
MLTDFKAYSLICPGDDKHPPILWWYICFGEGWLGWEELRVQAVEERHVDNAGE